MDELPKDNLLVTVHYYHVITRPFLCRFSSNGEHLVTNSTLVSYLSK